MAFIITDALYKKGIIQRAYCYLFVSNSVFAHNKMLMNLTFCGLSLSMIAETSTHADGTLQNFHFLSLSRVLSANIRGKTRAEKGSLTYK